jgi:hypothetical protein
MGVRGEGVLLIYKVLMPGRTKLPSIAFLLPTDGLVAPIVTSQYHARLLFRPQESNVETRLC